LLDVAGDGAEQPVLVAVELVVDDRQEIVEAGGQDGDLVLQRRQPCRCFRAVTGGAARCRVRGSGCCLRQQVGEAGRSPAAPPLRSLPLPPAADGVAGEYRSRADRTRSADRTGRRYQPSITSTILPATIRLASQSVARMTEGEESKAISAQRSRAT
jgi:hypothetical protein